MDTLTVLTTVIISKCTFRSNILLCTHIYIYIIKNKQNPHWKIKPSKLHENKHFFYLAATYLELLFLQNPISRKWDVISSFLEQSLVHLRTVWTWVSDISLSYLTTVSELVSFSGMWKLQWCLHTPVRGLHCHLSSSSLFCCIFNHLGDGYSNVPTNWLNACHFRSCWSHVSDNHSLVSSSLQPIDSSLPGSCVYGTLQARILECVAISFSITLITIMKFYQDCIVKTLS